MNTEWAVWKDHDGHIIGCHVDDMCVAATPHKRKSLKACLESHGLLVNDLGNLDIYIGIRIQRDRSKRQIYLSQEEYILKTLKAFGMEDCKPIATPMADAKVLHGTALDLQETKQYQRLVGCLLYIMHGTRPDIAYPVIRLSQHAAHPNTDQWLALKRVLRYLKGTVSVKLVLGHHDDVDNFSLDTKLHDPATGIVSFGPELIGYFDAAYADSTNRRSTSGYLFKLFGSLISWSSEVQRTIALSTTEAEFMAATEAIKECLWIISVATELGWGIQRPIKLFGDNQGANALTRNPEYHQRTKHIDVRHRFITSLVEDGTISVIYIPSPSMLADMFTKPLPKAHHDLHCQLIGLSFGSNSDLVCLRCTAIFNSQKNLHRHIINAHLNKKN